MVAIAMRAGEGEAPRSAAPVVTKRSRCGAGGRSVRASTFVIRVAALAAEEPLSCMGAHWFGALAGSAERITARDGGVVTWTKPPVHLLRAQSSSPALAASTREMSMHSTQSVEEAATAWTMQRH